MAQPSYTVDEFAFVSDDGTESTATVGTIDANISQGAGTANRHRVRLQLHNDNDKAGSEIFNWEYSRNSGAWTAINAVDSSYVRAIASGYSTPPADGTDCTNRLTSRTPYDATNAGWTNDGSGGTSTLDAQAYFELELCYYLIEEVDSSNGDTIEFRVSENSGDTITPPTNWPQATLSLAATASDNNPAYVRGSQTASDNQLAYTRGSLDAGDNQPAYIDGIASSTDNKSAYTRGQDTASDNKAAYLEGSLSASDNQPAYARGQDSASDNQLAYVRGQDSASDNAPAYLEGSAGASQAVGNQPAYIAGTDTASDNKSAYLRGSQAASDNKGVFIRGCASAYGDRVKSVEPSSLIAFWTLCEDAGTNAHNAEGTISRDGTFARDVSTMGTGSGIGDGNTAPDFDGANDFVNIATSSLATVFDGNAGSVSVWFKVSASGIWTDGLAHTILQLRDSSGVDWISIQKVATNNRINVLRRANGANVSVVIDGLSSTDWIHIVLTWNTVADELKVYLDGYQYGSTETGLNSWTGTDINTAYTAIGTSYRPSVNAPWDGLVAHTAIWDTEVSASQAEYLANRASSNQSAYIRGNLTSSDSKQAYIEGDAGATDNKSAYIAGTATASANVSAYMRGQSTSDDSTPAYIEGVLFASDNKSAFIEGELTCPVVDIQGAAGRISTCDTLDSYGRAISHATPTSDVEALLKYQFNETDSQAIFRTVIRGSGDWDSDVTPTKGYEVAIASDGGYTIYRIETGSRTSIGSGAWAASTNAYWIRFQASGLGIKFRIWQDGSGEPGTWDNDIDDSTSGFTTAGVLQLAMSTTIAGSAHTIYLDDISYHSPSNAASDNQPAYIRGQVEVTDNQPAYIRGAEDSTDNQEAYIRGADSASDNQEAYIRGQADTSDSREAYIRGAVDETDSQPAYIAGSLAVASSQPAYIAGGVPAASSQAAYMEGIIAGTDRTTYKGMWKGHFKKIR